MVILTLTLLIMAILNLKNKKYDAPLLAAEYLTRRGIMHPSFRLSC